MFFSSRLLAFLAPFASRVIAVLVTAAAVVLAVVIVVALLLLPSGLLLLLVASESVLPDVVEEASISRGEIGGGVIGIVHGGLQLQ